MKKSLSIIFLMLVCFCAFSAQFHTVPLDNEAYRIIEVAEIRGIIKPQTDVKPYSLDVVRNLLSEIKNSNEVSLSEKTEIDKVNEYLDKLYGNKNSTTIKDIKANGFYRTSTPDGKTNATLGISFATDDRVGIAVGENSGKLLDSRNTITGFLRGDFMDVISYDMSISGLLDRLDLAAFSRKTDFYTDCEGKYLDLLHGGNGVNSRTSEGFFEGFAASSEIATSINEGLMTARIGSIKHDWGVGNGNLALSNTARSFDAFEFSIKPVDWVTYSVLNGSLGKFAFENEYKVWPSDGWHEDLFDNNFALHRVEVDAFKFAKLSIWESVVYRKRFEMSYLNPFQIYMFVQNSLGDFDNMLAGVDFSLNFKKLGTFYFATAMDEMNSFKKVFNCPRNIFAVQAGYTGSVKLLDFTKFNAQFTYVPPFFGTHYGNDNPLTPAGDLPYKTTYVNKGQNLGYNLDPDSIEVKFSADTSYQGYKFSFGVSETLRSYQYAMDAKNGQNMLNSIYYECCDTEEKNGKWGQYYSKDFFNNIGEKIFSMEGSIEKSFDDMPFTIALGANLVVDSFRTIKNLDSIKVKVVDSAGNAITTYDNNPYGGSYVDAYVNPGNPSFNSWANTYKLIGTLAVKFYY